MGNRSLLCVGLLFLPLSLLAQPPAGVFAGGAAEAAPSGTSLKVLSWNIERGLKLPAVAAFLEDQAASMVLLQEVDVHARRTERKDLPEELAKRLGKAYLFAAEFEELGQGSRDVPAYHGQAVLTSLAASNSRVIRFEEQTGFWRPRWYLPNLGPFQRRVGGRLALVTEVEAAGRRLVVYNVHLESRGSEQRRLLQMREILADAQRYPAGTPMLIAGDFNTRVPSPPAVSALLDAGFHRAVGQQVTTARGQALDWIFVRGPLAAEGGVIHSHVRASDHFPLTVRIRFDPPAVAEAGRLKAEESR